MTYTSHGHHIEETMDLGVELPMGEIRLCGGPGDCGTCTREAVDLIEESKEVEREVAFHYAAAIAEMFEALRQEIEKNYVNSRERSLVRTNIDQAELWLTKCEEEGRFTSADRETLNTMSPLK